MNKDLRKNRIASFIPFTRTYAHKHGIMRYDKIDLNSVSILSKNKKGFSLIELLVVMTISMILVGVGFMGFSSIIKDRNLKRSEKELRSILYEAKQGAFYGKKTTNVGCKVFQGNRVVVGTNSLSTSFYCKDASNNDVYYSGKTVNFNGVTLEASGNFIFYSVGSDTKTSITPSSTFNFKLKVSETKFVTVSVTSDGEIR